MLDVALPERAADRQLWRDVGVVQLLGLQIGRPFEQPRQDAQPYAPNGRAKGGDDLLPVPRIRNRGGVIYQMPSSALASSEAMMRGSQRGVHTRLMSTSWTAGKRLVRTEWA